MLLMANFKSAEYLVLESFTFRGKPAIAGDPLIVKYEEDHLDIESKPYFYERYLQFVSLSEKEVEETAVKTEAEVLVEAPAKVPEAELKAEVLEEAVLPELKETPVEESAADKVPSSASRKSSKAKDAQ